MAKKQNNPQSIEKAIRHLGGSEEVINRNMYRRISSIVSQANSLKKGMAR